MMVLADLNQVSLEQQIVQLRAENDALRQASQRALTLKVSDKGAISVYGMGRFPITLYRGQMERLLGMAPAIRAFIEANSARLSVKE